MRLHIVQGGIENGDKKWLERAASENRSARSWIVPKHVTIGDDVIIYIRGYGLFATCRIKSRAKPRPDWNNRYGAALENIRLIQPPISIAAVQRHIPALTWALYPRSITTPPPNIANQVWALVHKRVKAGVPDLDDEALLSANIDELRSVALLAARKFVTPEKRQVLHRARSLAIRLYVLHRAKGRCEGCLRVAPFHRADGSPFLEPHHTHRLADDGPDHPAKVIALCPNCHRRAHYSQDAKAFNRSLIKKLSRLEQ